MKNNSDKGIRMIKTLFIIGNYKIKSRSDSYLKLLQGYLELEDCHTFIPIKEWIENLDECECKEGESCYVCDDYGDKNIVFQLDKHGEQVMFFKIPEEFIGNQEEMAKWFFENLDVLKIGDVLYEGEEIESQEDYECADQEDLIKIRDYSKLISMGRDDDFSFLEENETIFKIYKLQSGKRRSII